MVDVFYEVYILQNNTKASAGNNESLILAMTHSC